MAIYEMERFNVENIQKFFDEQDANINKFIFAVQMPRMTTYVLFGTMGNLSMCNYIIGYNSEKMYFLKLSRISNKKIEDYKIIPLTEIKKIDFKGFLGISYKMKITMENNKKLGFQVNKKIKAMPKQAEYIEELKNLV